MAANNARAREAFERLGTPPSDILQGTRRSEFAPNIQRDNAATYDDEAEKLDEQPKEQATSSDIELQQAKNEESTNNVTQGKNMTAKQSPYRLRRTSPLLQGQTCTLPKRPFKAF